MAKEKADAIMRKITTSFFKVAISFIKSIWQDIRYRMPFLRMAFG
jgi:hypothetical protein